MKKKILLIIFVLHTGLGFTQNRYEAGIFHDFKKSYNSGYYALFYQDFSSNMKANQPLKKLQQFLKGVKMRRGKILHSNFIGKVNSHTAKFKAELENGDFLITLILNDRHQVNGYFIKPFIGKPAFKAAVHALSSFPPKIASLIAEKAQNFPNKTQLAIGVIQQGKTEFYGLIRKNDSLLPRKNENCIFAIGSITKVFTATVLAHLVTRGKLALTDSIAQFYGFPFHNHVNLSFMDLANHTSGLPRLPTNMNSPDLNDPYKAYNAHRLTLYLKKYIHLKTLPGKSFSYSNLGYGLLGFTLGKTQGTSLEKLIQKFIFTPYNMDHSFTKIPRDSLLVSGINQRGHKTPPWHFGALFGAGGVFSTARDLASFIRAQWNPAHQALQLTQKPTFTVNNQRQIGLGWAILKGIRPQPIYWKNGETGGFCSSLAFDPKDKCGVVVLANVSAFNPQHRNIDQLCFALMRQIAP